MGILVRKEFRSLKWGEENFCKLKVRWGEENFLKDIKNKVKCGLSSENIAKRGERNCSDHKQRWYARTSHVSMGVGQTLTHDPAELLAFCMINNNKRILLCQTRTKTVGKYIQHRIKLGWQHGSRNGYMRTLTDLHLVSDSYSTSNNKTKIMALLTISFASCVLHPERSYDFSLQIVVPIVFEHSTFLLYCNTVNPIFVMQLLILQTSKYRPTAPVGNCSKQKRKITQLLPDATHTFLTIYISFLYLDMVLCHFRICSMGPTIRRDKHWK